MHLIDRQRGDCALTDKAELTEEASFDGPPSCSLNTGEEGLLHKYALFFYRTNTLILISKK